MSRPRKQLRRGAELDDASGVQHGDPIAEVADEVEVVADEEDAEALLALEPPQEAKDLLSNGDVERGRRLVGDQQARAADDRHRDHRPLQHSAQSSCG